MSIKKIIPYIVRYKEPNDYNNYRMTVLVEIKDSDGTSGWGEAIAMWPEACNAVIKLVEGLSELIVGQDASKHDELWYAMRAHSWWYGEGGIASMSIAAIDMALWDLHGKQENKPVWQLLGKRYHESLPACASLHVNEPTVEKSVEAISGFINDDGFLSTKLGFAKKGESKIGFDRKQEILLIKGLKEALPADTPIHVDIGNGVKWTQEEALATMNKMQEIGVEWIEEPLYPTDYAGYKFLRQNYSGLIASGEREFTQAGYQRLLESDTVDVFGIDPARVEGITGHLNCANMLADANKVVNAHAWSTAISSAASLALSVCCKTAQLFELKPRPSPMQHELVDNPIWHDQGHVAPNDLPGLGVVPKQSVVEKYQVS